MKQLVRVQVYLLVGILLTVFFYSINTAHASFDPPLYCMGMGGNCSDTPTPSLSSNIPEQNEPCSEERNPGGFLSTIFNFFYSLFNPQYTSSQDLPCSATKTTPTIIPGSATQSSSEPISHPIQFIDHKVVQVPGEDMFITVEKLNSVEPGDILVAMIGSDYAHVSEVPSGWKTIRQDVKNSGHLDDLAMQSYYKIVTSEEQSSYTWNLVTGRKDTPSSHQPLIAVDLYAFRNVDSSEPIASSDANSETEDAQAINCPSVKGIAGGVLLCAYIGDDPGPITAPSSMEQTSNFEIAEGDSYAAAYETLTSSDETGTRIAQWNNPGRNKDGSLKSGSDFAHAIVLRPLK